MQIRNDSQPETFVKYEGQVPDGIAKKNFESARIDFRKKPLPGARCVNVWMMHRLYNHEETMINHVYTLQITTALVRLVKPS